MPERGTLFVVPIDRAQQRVDVDERALLDAGQQRHPRREPHQMRSTYRGELVGVSEGELAQEDPQCRGRIHLVEHPRVPPARSRFTSSMLSAPHIMPAMIVVSLPAGLTAPDFTRVDRRSTCWAINRERPVCSANSSTGTKPAADTRFRSSNTADPTVNVYDDCTENAFPNTGHVRHQHSYCPSSEGIFAVHTPITSPAHPRIQA
jgi:hypothetical protein